MIKLFSEIPMLNDEMIVLKKLEYSDAEFLAEFSNDKNVYQYLPTFLFEQQYRDMKVMIYELYEKSFKEKESLILGIVLQDSGALCGLAEFYGYKESIQKTCIGYRLSPKFWGKGIATRTVALMVDYLYSNTDIEIITASTMIENQAS